MGEGGKVCRRGLGGIGESMHFKCEEPENCSSRDPERLLGASLIVGAPELVEVVPVAICEDVRVREAPFNNETSHLITGALRVAGEEQD